MPGPSRIWGFWLGLAVALTGCSPSHEGGRVVHVDRSDLPLDRASTAELARFAEGDNLFEATLREADGLGPLYIRASCTACHRSDGRGPGLVGSRSARAAQGAPAMKSRHRRSHPDGSRCSTLARAASVLVTASVVSCGNARSEAPLEPPPSPSSFIALERDFQNFRTWTPIDLPERAPQGITHVAGQRREYINRRPPPASSAFPVGTILVKELLTQAPEGHQIFAMVKRGGGYNSRGAPGWEWFELREREDHSVGMVWRGLSAPVGESYGGDPLGTCSNCHQLAVKNDYVRAGALALGGR